MLGVYDATEACFLGDGEGPFAFRNHELARLGMTLLWHRMRGASKLEVREIPDEQLRKRDEFAPPLSLEEAWHRASGLP